MALYRSQRHPEGPHDLALGGRAVDDELAGEQSETPQILRLVGEDRQMAVKVDHLGITALESQFRYDQGRPFWEHGQLDLRHPAMLSFVESYAKSAHAIGPTLFQPPHPITVVGQEF